MKASLKSTCLPPVHVQTFEDPQEVYTEQIFHINTLCVPALLVAIQTLDPESSALSALNQQLSVDELKRMTWKAITAEVLTPQTNNALSLIFQ